VAHSERVRSTLGWRPRYDDLPTIVRDALDWERKLTTRQTRPAVAGRKAAI
jgi:UDP-glucose 4-epimerase